MSGWNSKTGETGSGDSKARSKNSSGYRSSQSTYSDAVKAKAPNILPSSKQIRRERILRLTLRRVLGLG